MKNIALPCALMLVLASPFLAHAADTYTLSTYYPAPNGRYQTLTTNDLTVNNTTAFMGNVGIGVNPPPTTLAVYGSDPSNVVMKIENSSDTGYSEIEFLDNDGTTQGTIGHGNHNCPKGTQQDKFYVGTQSAEDFMLISTDQPRVYVTANGNVGIGNVPAPAYQLEVNGTTGLGETTIGGPATINSTAHITGNTTIGNDLVLGSAGGYVGLALGSGGKYTISTDDNLLLLSSGAPSTSGLVLSGNNVGIGMVPTTALEVTGISKIHGDATFSGSTLFAGVTQFGAAAAPKIVTVYGDIDSKTGNVIAETGNVNINTGMLTLKGGTMSMAPDPTGTIFVFNQALMASAHLYPSDARLKEHVAPITDALAKVEALNGVSFNYKTSPEKRIGLIAQNVELTVPEVVRTGADGMKSVDYANLVGLLIEAIKEQQGEIEQLKQNVQQQEQRLGSAHPGP